MRYKVWVQIEGIDEAKGEYNSVSEPICIKESGTYAEAHRVLCSLASLFDPEINDDYAYPLESFGEDDSGDNSGDDSASKEEV